MKMLCNLKMADIRPDPWIDERVPGNTNEVQSRMQLDSLFRRMKDEVRENNDTIIKEQLELGIIEETQLNPDEREYIV